MQTKFKRNERTATLHHIYEREALHSINSLEAKALGSSRGIFKRDFQDLPLSFSDTLYRLCCAILGEGQICKVFHAASNLHERQSGAKG